MIREKAPQRTTEFLPEFCAYIEFFDAIFCCQQPSHGRIDSARPMQNKWHRCYRFNGSQPVKIDRCCVVSLQMQIADRDSQGIDLRLARKSLGFIYISK